MPAVNPEQIKRTFEKLRMYKQAGAVKPLYVSNPWRACMHLTLAGKRLPISWAPLAVYLRNDFFEVYFTKEQMARIAAIYEQRHEGDHHFIQTLKHRWERDVVRPLARCIARIEKINLRTLNDKELMDHYLELNRLYSLFWPEAIFLDAFDVMSDTVLARAVERNHLTIANEDLHFLTSVPVLSWLQRERAALLALCTRVRRNPALQRIVQSGAAMSTLQRQFPSFARLLEKHVAQYHWIYNDYAVIRHLDARYFLRAICDLIRHPEKRIQEEHAIAEARGIAAKQQALARKLRLPQGMMATIQFLTTLATWRDVRKVHNQMTSAVLRQFAEELHRRTKVPLRTIEYLWWWEVPAFLKTRQVPRDALRRRDGVFCFNDPIDPKHLFFGAEGKRLHRFIDGLMATGNTLEGRVAFPGVVRGIVKIIRSQNDFKKMKRGDILVAPNTRPEYVPIMKIAGAIISEEGGLTCHSAIVARELKIPAIVGAQGAIAALKDGDRVEVDALHGVVRKV